MTAPSPADLDHQVRHGTRTVLAAQIAAQIVSLVVLAIMMRLVAPAEYGLLGMVLPVVMLPRMATTLGLSTAVLQRKLSAEQLTSLFWLNVTGGLVAAALTALGGVWLAQVYSQPILGPVGLALAGATIIAALGNQHQALLERRLKFAPLAAVRLLSLVAGGIAGIQTARRGGGIWALVAQQYGELAVLTLWVWLIEPWRPGWPRRSASVAGLIRFSGFYSVSQLVYFVAQNLDKVLLPALVGPAADRWVGLYSQAFNFFMKPVYLLTAPLTGVMVAGLSQAVSREERTALASRFFRLVAMGLFPCAAGLLVTASDVMLVLGGPAWRASGWVLAALAPALLTQGLVNAGGHVLASAGKSGRLLFAMLVLTLLLTQASLVGFFLGREHLTGEVGSPASGGMLGIALGYTAVLLVVWGPAYLWFCLRSADLPPRPVLLPLWRPLLAALAMGLAVFALRQLPVLAAWTPAARLSALVIAGMLVYAFFARGELRWLAGELVSPRLAKSPQRVDGSSSPPT
ncbi:MAG: oligosaccharide flippase family protein [Pirellulaceae bacterium]|nr:oligosaccharide flippase family protein [Pirellulaceae bacterium]